MDPQNTPIQNTQPIVDEPQRNWTKIALYLIAGLLFGATLIFAGYKFGSQKSSQAPLYQSSPTPSLSYASPTASIATSSPSPTPFDSGIPITVNTVSFARGNGSIYFQYKGKAYGIVTQNQPYFQYFAQISPIPQNNYTWYGLINTPSNIVPDSYDEVFDFKLFPDGQNFIFIIRYDTPFSSNQFTEELHVYYYNAYAPSNKVSEILSFKPTGTGEYDYPRVQEVSRDGNNIAFNMFGCWNCGGHQPETMLFNMTTKQQKRIGKVKNFTWKENGAYEYKDYVVIQCSEPTPGECSEDPNKLPLKTGVF